MASCKGLHNSGGVPVERTMQGALSMEQSATLRDRARREQGGAMVVPPTGSSVAVVDPVETGQLTRNTAITPRARPALVDEAPRKGSVVPHIEERPVGQSSPDLGAKTPDIGVASTSRQAVGEPGYVDASNSGGKSFLGRGLGPKLDTAPAVGAGSHCAEVANSYVARSDSGHVAGSPVRHFLATTGKIAMGVGKFLLESVGIWDLYESFKCFLKGDIRGGLGHLVKGAVILGIAWFTMGTGGAAISLGRGALKMGFKVVAGRAWKTASLELGETLAKEGAVSAGMAGVAKGVMAEIRLLATGKLGFKAASEVTERQVQKGVVEWLTNSHNAVEIIGKAVKSQVEWLKNAAAHEISSELGMSTHQARLMKFALKNPFLEGMIKKIMAREVANGLASDMARLGAKEAFMGVMGKELTEFGAERGLSKAMVDELIAGVEQGIEKGLRKALLEVATQGVNRGFKKPRVRDDNYSSYDSGRPAEAEEKKKAIAKAAAVTLGLSPESRRAGVTHEKAKHLRQWWAWTHRKTEHRIVDGELMETSSLKNEVDPWLDQK